MILILSGFLLRAQNKLEILTPSELKEDFRIFRTSLEEAHPGLYWFTTKAEMDHLFDSTYAELDHEMSGLDFWVTLSKLTTHIGCLHTHVYGFKFSEDQFLLPFTVHIEGQKTYIHQDLVKDRNLVGAEILAINGRPASEILHTFLKLVPHDGYVTGFSRWLLNYQYTFYHADVFRNESSINLEIKLPNQAPETITIEGYKFDHWQKKWRQQFGNNHEDVIQLKFVPESSTAILKVARLGNWKVDGKKYRFKKVIKEKMGQIIASGSKNLILDIGDQGGGNEKYGMQLLSYFIDEPYTPYRAIEFKTNRYKTSKKYSNTSWYEYHALKTLLRIKKTDSTYLLQNFKGLKPTKPSPLQFKGDMYLLTSGSTASATSDFAAWVHHLKLATTIGEETGGGYQGNTSNWEFTITLPHSKARLLLPLARYFNNVDDGIFFGRGMIPEHIVKHTFEDRLKGHDPQLEFALELIQNKAKENRND
ncbi:MAG: S41 family peptidase [Cytophagales bacterium]|nr:S41 family peptidase [Cytophagales bacterium]